MSQLLVDATVGAVVGRGAGNAFCAGADRAVLAGADTHLESGVQSCSLRRRLRPAGEAG